MNTFTDIQSAFSISIYFHFHTLIIFSSADECGSHGAVLWQLYIIFGI